MLSQRCGREFRLSADCEYLTLDIESATGEHLGVNTMKRLLGFINDERVPRVQTLDIIARYLGFNNWEELLRSCENYSNSSFGKDTEELTAADLEIGAQVEVLYQPGRRLLMQYNGENMFEVVESVRSKLVTGDKVTLTHLVAGYPLIISNVERNGQQLGAFTAGKEQGINFKLL